MSHEIIIEPGRSEKNYWKDLWRYRELFYILSWRDIKVRYKQTMLGIGWSVIRPLLTMLIFSFLFSRVAHNSSPGLEYKLIVFAGLLPWQFFASGLSEAGNSLVGNERLISKVYFPRMVIPASSIITSLVDFFISMFLMAALLIIYKTVPSWNLIFLPLFIIMAFLTCFGAGLWLTSLNVKYRDFKYIVPFIVQLGIYVSPVAYTSDAFINKQLYQRIYHLNPMAGVIDGFRWCFFGNRVQTDWINIFISLAVTLFLVAMGIRTFRKMEKSFADII